MTDYDHLRGYLHSDTLSWSYGGVKGRRGRVAATPGGEADRRSRPTRSPRSGFDGVWLDRFGYGPDLAQVEAELTPRSGRR